MTCIPVSLNTALMHIASRFGLDAVDLAEFVLEDDIGGYHPDPAQAKWPIGSIWHVEGQILYALVRALKPRHVLELGTYHGCSATHIAAALRKNGDGGLLTCVDNGHDARGQFKIGHLIPDELQSYVLVIDQDLAVFTEDTRQTFDFIFEDAFHSPEQVEAVWRQMPRLLNPGGVAVSHDACHFIVGG